MLDFFTNTVMWHAEIDLLKRRFDQLHHETCSGKITAEKGRYKRPKIDIDSIGKFRVTDSAVEFKDE